MFYMPYLLPSTEGGVGGVEKGSLSVAFTTPLISASTMKPCYDDLFRAKEGDVHGC